MEQVKTQIKANESRKELQTSNIGSILLCSGKITARDQEKIIALQDREGLLFGEAAVKLGILTEEDMTWALATQHSYPYIQCGDNTISQEAIVIHQPCGPHAEAFRSIRSKLVLSGAGKVLTSIAVMSPADGEGKTFIAVNLAAVFAQLGSKTLLIDGNLRSPRIHEIFKVKNNCGLSSLIINRAEFEQAMHATVIDSLHILPAGPKPPNPVELLGWQETRDLMDVLKKQYDVIIIDSPSFLKTADSSVIATLSDGAVMVALKGNTSRESFGRVKKQLDASHVKIIGSLINEMNGKRTNGGKKA